MLVRLLKKPPLLITLSFFLVILAGSLLLKLPIASEDGISTPYVDCLFTATSATCVTGLIVVDTADHWSNFGELVILVMIQIGGLGFITLAVFFLSFMSKRKAGLKSIILAQESINSISLQDTIPLIRQILILIFFAEAAGAFLLSLAFVPEYGLYGVYMGIFHAISAFCNAGFDLMGGFKSLSDYNGNFIVLYTINALIVIGGLGFIVWKDVLDYRKTKKLLVHTRIVLAMTAVLLVVGTLFIYVLEYSNGLKSLLGIEKLNGAVFLSVNARTAGYASINLNNMQDITKVFVAFLMFIGGASGSTAGGIKINTFGIMLTALVCVVRSDKETILLGRRIPNPVVLRAFAVTALSLSLIFVVMIIISLLNPQWSLINILFEVVSGFATVGLTTGITPDLDTASKLLIALCMFVGRVGPLSFILTLSRARKEDHNSTIYPEGKFIVG